ncbi:7980_t:CDS:2, partial [Dentiscutata erythropus]
DADARSIYVSKVNRKITAQVLRVHFEQCGEIIGIKIICKIFSDDVNDDVGHAFIEFSKASSVEDALHLDISSIMEYRVVLHDEITRDELENPFQIYGNVLDIAINDSKNGKYAFIVFATKEMAEHALQADGEELGGRQIRVRRYFLSENSIRIAGFGESISPGNLCRHFKGCGKIKQVSIYDSRRGRSAIMNFVNSYSVERALRKNNTMLINTPYEIKVQ